MIGNPFFKEGCLVQKRGLFALLALSFSISCFAEPLWHCIATSHEKAVWNWYGNTERETRSVVDKECASHNDRKACGIVCFPPRVYWRCLSHDLPSPTKENPNPKHGTWYWASFSKQIAINGAMDACRHNSAFGGCSVDETACASS